MSSPFGYGKGPFGQIPYGGELFAGLSSLSIEDLLEDIALALVEPVVNTILGKNTVGDGSVQTVQPRSMVGIYVGALLLAGNPLNIEQITVLSVTSTTFTAAFVNQHYASEALVGSTFPSGQTDHPLFTQQEIIGYIADVQNDFLLKTRSIYGVTGTFSEPPNIPIFTGLRFYSQPASTIRLERLIGVSGSASGSFPLVLFNFQRPNQNPINTNWKLYSANPDPGIVMGQILNNEFVSQKGTLAAMLYDGGVVWPADQYSEGTLASLAVNNSVALFVRGNLVTGDGYAFELDAQPGHFGGMGVPTQFFINSLENDFLSGSLTPHPGDVFRIQVQGNIISVFQNGVLVASVQGDNSVSGGKPGIAADSTFGISQNDAAWSSWNAGGVFNSNIISNDLYETTQSDLDLGDYSWVSRSGPPEQWFRDLIDTGVFGLYPLPPSAGFLEAWYSKRGPLGNAGVLNLLSTLLIPDVMSHYVKYGTLSLCWGKDGESHNPLRAEYCRKRYELGIVLVNRFMEGIGIQAQPKNNSTFSPMAIPSGEGTEITGG